VTAAPPDMPQALIDQLADHGRLIAPVGSSVWQVLVVVERVGAEITRRETIPVRFVPMV
jgi:protein-L-isoaspartate(D-aspartate) O-methyltransferase